MGSCCCRIFADVSDCDNELNEQNEDYCVVDLPSDEILRSHHTVDNISYTCEYDSYNRILYIKNIVFHDLESGHAHYEPARTLQVPLTSSRAAELEKVELELLHEFDTYVKSDYKPNLNFDDCKVDTYRKIK